MGCVASQSSRSNEIDQLLNKERELRRRKLTFLMLGRWASGFLCLTRFSGDSGKSTFTRQMSLIYSPNPISPSDYIKYSEVIKLNTLSSMQELLHILRTQRVKLKSRYKVYRNIVNQANHLDPEVAGGSYDIKLLIDLDAIAILWQNSSVRQAYDERYSSALSSAEYYFQHVKRFAQPDFMCTDQDVPCMYHCVLAFDLSRCQNKNHWYLRDFIYCQWNGFSIHWRWRTAFRETEVDPLLFSSNSCHFLLCHWWIQYGVGRGRQSQ